ncbi:hypothetical protein Plhal304r1_c006g0022961 [Plasmopara halstedii]
MRLICLSSLTMSVTLVRAHGHHILMHRRHHQSPNLRQHGYITTLSAPNPYCHSNIELEILYAQLRLEMQELLAKRSEAHINLQESNDQGKCECESLLLPTPVPAPAQSTQSLEAKTKFNESNWKLKLTESSSGSTGSGTASSKRHRGSFFTSTIFVMAVFLMIIPVACVIGFVILSKRRRRPHYTHA